MLDRVTIERAAALAGDGPILIALSGGGDSVALLHLLAERAGALRLRAAIVDHALRPGSADDARRAQGFAERLGVQADVLTLAWPHSARRAQQPAREARYRALCEAARRTGSRVVAVAHTADDQAETVLMRAAGGSTWRGLAGMAPIAPAPVWPEGRGVWLARPLLDVRRSELRAALRARGGDWIEDPANVNEAYERVRVRARLAGLERAGFDVERLTRLARKLRPRVEKSDQDAAALIVRAAQFEGERVVIDRAAWTGAAEVRRRALSVLIAAAGGSAREPGRAEVERLESLLARSDFRGASLGGAVLARSGAGVSVSRDPGALVGRVGGPGPLAPLPAPTGEPAVWDGRLEIRARETGWTVLPSASGPILEQGGRRLRLADAAGVVEARWLVRDHARFLLGFGAQ